MMHESKQEPASRNQAEFSRQTLHPTVERYPEVSSGKLTPLVQRITQVGRSPTARVQANLLNRAIAHQPTQTRQLLLQLQQQYGNRYVQRVVNLSRQAEGEAQDATPEVETAIDLARGQGQSLDRSVQRQMESAFGTSFTGVRVHTDSRADTLNQVLSARAFTTGQDIFFRQGEYDPGSASGRELLAHELTHVVQQTGGTQAKLQIGQPDDVYEQEADTVAQAIMKQERSLISNQSTTDKPMLAKVEEAQVQRQPQEQMGISSAEEPEQKAGVEEDISTSGGTAATPPILEEKAALVQSKPSTARSHGPVIQRQLTEAGVAAAALGYEILTGAIATMQQGDLQVTWPTSEVGVVAQTPPAGVRQRTQMMDQVIFRYRKANPISGIEQVNIRLRCIVQFNGPEVKATFGFAAGGARSRLMRDSQVNIRNPVNLQTIAASADWQRAGVPEYPVVHIPIEVNVNHPWPQSNDNWTFTLVLSGMHGFSARGGSGIENYVHTEN